MSDNIIYRCSDDNPCMMSIELREDVEELRASIGLERIESHKRIAALEAELRAANSVKYEYSATARAAQVEIARLNKLVMSLESDLAAARAALEAVEWVGDPNRQALYCPWCNSLANRHAPDCVRQVALGLANKP